MSDTFIPNSFQVPNAYVDKMLHLLHGDEVKVLLYAIRRIFGFQKRQDSISISQFMGGLRAHSGDYLDHGTGMCTAVVSQAIKSLQAFGILILIEPNDPQTNNGATYALQLKEEAIAFEKLEARRLFESRANKSKTEKARDTLLSYRKARFGETRSVGQDAPPLSDRTPPLCGTETQYQEENKGKQVEREHVSIEKRKQETKEALITGIRKYAKTGLDLSEFPEEVRLVVEVVCNLWRLQPPRRTKKGGEFQYWIDSARELRQACGEFGVIVIEQYRKRFMEIMSKQNGIPPHTVSGPGSLIKSVRAEAGYMRAGYTTGEARDGRRAETHPGIIDE